MNTPKTVTQVSPFFHNVANTSKIVKQIWVFFQNVINTLKSLMQVIGLFSESFEHIQIQDASFAVFFPQCCEQIKKDDASFGFFHDIVNQSKICDENLDLLSKCSQHMKNRDTRFGLFFTMFSTHKKEWSKFPSIFQNVANTSKTVVQLSIYHIVNTSKPVMQAWVFLSQCCKHIKNRHSSFCLYFTTLWTHQKSSRKFWSFYRNAMNKSKNMHVLEFFFTMLWTHQKSLCKFRSFLTMLYTHQKRDTMWVLVFFSQYCEHI